MDFEYCEAQVATARDKQSKPYANNTRIEKRGEDAYALRLHATDIATFYRDGRITINSGGWRTVTTMERLRHVTHHVYSEGGVWYVRAEPNPSDPEPIRGERTVPKPFHALDPGEEPVRDDSVPEHVAGTETVRTETVRVFIKAGEEREGDREIESEATGGYFSAYVEREIEVATYWRAERHRNYWQAEEIPSAYPEADKHENEQCPHCKLFDAQHDAWEIAYEGERWGRNPGRGYRQMCELLDRYGDHDTWQDAYIADFRAAREARTIHKAWVERNRVLFEDGMEITAEGYAKRPNLKEVARAERAAKRIDRKKQRINKFVADAVHELAANGVRMPSGGDCFGCLFRATEDRSIEPMGVDHLDQHIRERYYVPSMFVNAMREAGYQDAGIYMLLGMNPEADRMGGEGSRVSEDSVTRALRRYLYNRLIPELSQKKVTA
jgi:hypothetical protein